MICQNETIATGNFSNPAIWSTGRVPLTCGNIIIKHNLQVDTSLQVSAIEIKAEATLNVNNTRKLTPWQPDDVGTTNELKRSSLNINGGHLDIRGRIKAYPGSSFNMPKGTLKINRKPEFDLQ